MEGGNAALGSFSNKSKACYLLGLISADVFEDIQLIRTMRNDAAHKLATISFEETDFKNKVYSLTIVKNLVEPANPKDTFVFEIGLINMLLVDKILKIKRIKTPESDMKFFKEDEHFRKIFYEDN
ncbi:Mannitol repressor [Pontibacter chinhatensis]|uniref:Mannitol repressor n=2 Tax=Pontibacter chinhatensis TaxID=1436961 RepID=A0A1I2ZMI7_9BACT|nr:Mannitol repressor [Pontibacter chinhatensis]